jgi:peroxiredoxin
MMKATIDQADTPQIGTLAPDLELVDIEGATVRLSTYWRERPLVVVFLRHLACTFCQQQLAWLRRDHEKFKSAGVDIVCIAQGDAKVGKAYAILYDLRFPLLLCGDDLSAYRRYGLMLGTSLQLLHPRLLYRGLVSFLQGFVQTKVEGKGSQLGGGFVIDTGGYIRYLYRSRDASDTVRDEDLLAAAAKIGDSQISR